MTFLVLVGVVLIAIGVVWWQENHSAERPASLLILVGGGILLGIIGTAWWPL